MTFLKAADHTLKLKLSGLSVIWSLESLHRAILAQHQEQLSVRWKEYLTERILSPLRAFMLKCLIHIRSGI